MRAAPLLLLVLLGAMGAGLGLRVMLRSPASAANDRVAPAGATSDRTWPETIAGIPQAGIYTGLAEEPSNVNPYTCAASVARRFVLGFTHECLLDSDSKTGELRGALASAFEPAADGMSCEFTLRDGVRFSNGSPLTMSDVLFGWELAQAGHLVLGSIGDALRHVASVTPIDERRFRVDFARAHYAAVQMVGESWLVGKRQFFVDRVAQKARLAGEEPPDVGSAAFAVWLAQIVRECGPGTGPYTLVNETDGPSTWRTRQDLTVLRNEHCWRRDGAPGTWNFTGVRLLFRDPTAVATVLTNRDVDWFSSPTIADFMAADPTLRDDYRELAFDYRTLGLFSIAWNCRRTPFDLPEVRRALAKLCDLDTVVNRIFAGNGTVAKAFAKPAAADYPHDVESMPFDPAQARRELRDAGFDPAAGKPLRVVLLAPRGLVAMESTLDLFANAAKQAGVDLQIRMLEWSAFLEAKDRGDWDGVFVQQMFRPWGDPFEFVNSAGMDNQGGWSHPDADRLTAAIRVEMDADHRRERLHELHALVYREQPVLFVLHPQVSMLLGVHVQGAVPGPLGLDLEHAFFATDPRRRGR